MKMNKKTLTTLMYIGAIYLLWVYFRPQEETGEVLDTTTAPDGSRIIVTRGSGSGSSSVTPMGRYAGGTVMSADRPLKCGGTCDIKIKRPGFFNNDKIKGVPCKKQGDKCLCMGTDCGRG